MKNEIIMIQPNLSLGGTFTCMPPIGILYASSEAIKEGYTIHICDLRIKPAEWEKTISNLINERTLIVGFSVMGGIPVKESLKISRYIKQRWPKLYIVWGGPHATFCDNEVIKESSIDFVVRGYGSKPFLHLINCLVGKDDALPLGEINGITWKDEKGNYYRNEIAIGFEFIHYKDIPYYLIKDYSVYKYLGTAEKVFPMYSAMGCPYRCAFCSSPAQYSKFKEKWSPYNVKEVVEHIKMLVEKFSATYIYFIDDDSFVNLKHVENTIDEITKQRIKVKLGFRGARVNEVIKMSDDFLEKLVHAGTNSMHIGVESGSNRILTLIKKNITAEQILEVNRKLSSFPKIKVFYNFIIGFPTETIEETMMTRDLILRLIKDNPSCCVLPLNKLRPLPGTELYNLLVSYGYSIPKNLEEWAKCETESSDYSLIWLSEKHNKIIRMMFLAMHFIDDKIFKLSEETATLVYFFYKVIALFYKPIALFRFKHCYYKFLIENKFYNLIKYFSTAA